MATVEVATNVATGRAVVAVAEVTGAGVARGVAEAVAVVTRLCAADFIGPSSAKHER